VRVCVCVCVCVCVRARAGQRPEETVCEQRILVPETQAQGPFHKKAKASFPDAARQIIGVYIYVYICIIYTRIHIQKETLIYVYICIIYTRIHIQKETRVS